MKIYIGASETPYHVSEATLKAASDYFTTAIKHIELGVRSSPDTLRFPEDDRDAWEVFLHWLLKGTIPPIAGVDGWELNVKCWILGDRYNIPDFQDDAIFDMLSESESGFLPRLSAIQLAFAGTPQGSKLREYMAEEAWRMVTRGLISDQELDKALNGTLYLTEILTAKRLFDEKNKQNIFHNRFGRSDYVLAMRNAPWSAFILGDKRRLLGYVAEYYLD